MTTQTTPRISFEFFPPKTETMEEALFRAVGHLKIFAPHFVSVTYGASGSTRERTHACVSRLHRDYGLNVAAHLTCVGASRAAIDAIAAAYWRDGIRHIVALRGDPPEGQTVYQPAADGYAYATDLVAGLKACADFEITVGAYPETHPEAISAEADLDNLKRKMMAGASRAITQFFLDTDAFFRFRDRAVRAGITIPIIPGILPIANFARAAEFATRCGASIPATVSDRFTDIPADDPRHRAIALDFACEQIDALRHGDVMDFHFYTLNRADLVAPLCERLQS